MFKSALQLHDNENYRHNYNCNCNIASPTTSIAHCDYKYVNNYRHNYIAFRYATASCSCG